MMATPDVKSPADLKGKKMGIQDVGGFADVMNQLLLASVGLKRDDVQSISVTTAGRVPALVSGQINAHALHADQYYAALKQKPDLVVLAKMWEVAPKWWYSAFVASDDAVKKNPDLYIDFMTAVLKAQRWMYDPKNKAQVVAIAVKNNPGIGADAFDKAYDDLSKGGIWTVNDGMPKDFVDYTIQKKIEIGTQGMPKDLKYEQIVDLSVVNEAIKRLGGPLTGDPRWY
jgi:ABC-type nitrate/sulfonate/bicarbonate transport system substrate-binding protein